MQHVSRLSAELHRPKSDGLTANYEGGRALQDQERTGGQVILRFGVCKMTPYLMSFSDTYVRMVVDPLREDFVMGGHLVG